MIHNYQGNVGIFVLPWCKLWLGLVQLAECVPVVAGDGELVQLQQRGGVPRLHPPDHGTLHYSTVQYSTVQYSLHPPDHGLGAELRGVRSQPEVEVAHPEDVVVVEDHLGGGGAEGVAAQHLVISLVILLISSN